MIESDFYTHLAEITAPEDTKLSYDSNGVQSEHDANHAYSSKSEKQCIASRTRSKSCEAGCSVQRNEQHNVRPVAALEQQKLAEKANENQAEAEAEIHVEDAKAAE